jgi:Spy/CpxP family protein refolding chaperone
MTDPRSARKAPGGPLLAVMVLLVAVLAGGIAGVAADRLILLPHMHGPWHGGGPRDRGFRDRFARDVGLTPDQQTRIDSIMDRQGRELRAVRGQVQPQLDSIITRTRREFDAVLTPEQRKKAEAIRKRHPPPPGPPPGGFPGGPGRPEGPPPSPRCHAALLGDYQVRISSSSR